MSSEAIRLSEFWSFINSAAGVASIVAFILVFFFGVSSFDFLGFIGGKFRADRIPTVSDSVDLAEVNKRPIDSSRFLTYSMAEIVVISLNYQGKLFSSLVYLAVTLGPIFLALIVGQIFPGALFSHLLFGSSFVVGMFFLIGYPVFVSFENPIEVRFFENRCVITASVELSEDGNSLSIDRSKAKFSAGSVKVLGGGIFDYLCLSVTDGDRYVNVVMVPRWYARLFRVPRLGQVAKILNRVANEARL